MKRKVTIALEAEDGAEKASVNIAFDPEVPKECPQNVALEMAAALIGIMKRHEV